MKKFLLSFTVISSFMVSAQAEGLRSTDKFNYISGSWNLSAYAEDGNPRCELGTFYPDGSYIKVIAKFDDGDEYATSTSMEIMNTEWLAEHRFYQFFVKIESIENDFTTWDGRFLSITPNSFRTENLPINIIEGLLSYDTIKIYPGEESKGLEITASLDGFADAADHIEDCLLSFD